MKAERAEDRLFGAEYVAIVPGWVWLLATEFVSTSRPARRGWQAVPITALRSGHQLRDEAPLCLVAPFARQYIDCPRIPKHVLGDALSTEPIHCSGLIEQSLWLSSGSSAEPAILRPLRGGNRW